ncbi:MAG TPA: MFS transporter [Acidimicrobiia bacterium]|nr:MFS transporter [Acidimicrobiia bacterium]
MLRHRDFALVQTGNSISQLGTWMQYVALGWGIRELSSWPFAVALSLVAQFGPSLLLSPYAGSVADRFDRRRVVMLGNVLMVVPPMVIGVLVTLGIQTIVSILALAALGGVAQAMTQPAMIAIVPRIVPEDEITQAIASSSVLQNLTRIFGPTLGAVAISTLGLDWAFYLNGVSFLAVVAAWAFVHPPSEVKASGSESYATQIREGIGYARRHVQLVQLLIYAAVMSLVVYHSALLPVIATDVLHSGASGYGLLQSASGVGAILGALIAGEIVTDRRRRIALVGGVFVTGGAYAIVAFSRSLPLSLVGLGLFGFAFFMANAVSQSVLLTVTPDEYRGRIVGLYSTVVSGGVPIAALIGGAIGSLLGVTEAVATASFVLFAYGAWFVAGRGYRVIGVHERLDEPLDEGTPTF